MAMSIPAFRPKPAQKPHPLGRHIPYIAHMRDYPPDPHVQVTGKKKFAEAEGDNRTCNVGLQFPISLITTVMNSYQ